MKSTEKIQKLNELAEKLRVSVKEIAFLFQYNITIEHLVWKINKQISLLHQEVCKSLEKEVVDEQFNDLIQKMDFHDEL